MPYLTTNGYEARFGSEELAQVLASSPDADFDQALADAQSIVDSYLMAVPNRAFIVPLVLATTPARIVEITADLVRYELHAKQVTHEIKRRRDQAIEFLKDIARGLLIIPELHVGEGAVIVPEGGASFYAEERIFTRDTLAGY